MLMVDEKYYEELPDYNLQKMLPSGQHIEKVKAFPVTKPRVIGDIGLRGFIQLRKKALELVVKEKIDFVYIPIPSFYVSLIGPYLKRKTGVKYGIDYIDPWVHVFPGSDKLFSRHWFSTKLAKLLEPKAVKHSSLITGVAEGYYQGVIERNPFLKKSCVFGAMPYGGEETDHAKVKQLNLKPYLFSKNGKFQFVYAGAMLPKAYAPLEAMFRSVSEHKQDFSDVEFHFIGTGKTPNDPQAFNIRPLAEKYNLWDSVVFEYPKRIPYLDVLVHLEIADAVFILGSTEPHYTPSKTYQGVLSQKPIMAILHSSSTAVEIVRTAKAGMVLDFDGVAGVPVIEKDFQVFFRQFLSFSKEFNPANVNRSEFDQYSAYSVTQKLAELLNQLFPYK